MYYVIECSIVNMKYKKLETMIRFEILITILLPILK